MHRYKKETQKFLPFLIILLTVFLLAGCGGQKQSDQDQQTQDSSEQESGKQNSSGDRPVMRDVVRVPSTEEKGRDDSASKTASHRPENASHAESGQESERAEPDPAVAPESQDIQEPDGELINIVSEEEFDRILDENYEIGFHPEYLSWQQGEIPTDRAQETVYIPCSFPHIGQEEQPVPSRLALGQIMSYLKPDDEAGAIYYQEDNWMDDPVRAMEEGHRFEAVLILPQGSMRFSFILTGLPTVCIRTDGRDFVEKEDHFGTVSVLPCYEYDTESKGIGVQESSAVTGLEQRSWNCKLHLRGNMSMTLDKKGWKLTLLKDNGKKAKASLLGMRRDDDWILNPLYSDYSRVREMTAYQLWNYVTELSDYPCHSSRMQYVEVFMDNAYRGVYGLMEPVDGKQLKLTQGDLLYKIDYWDRDYPYLDLYDKSGGKMEILNDQDKSCIEIKYPKNWEDGATWEVMKQYHMFTIRSKDPEMLRSAGLETDMESVLTLNLFCTLTQAADNAWKNTYLIARKQPEGTMSRQADQSEPYPVKYRLYRDVWDLNYVFGDAYLYNLPNRHTQFILEDAENYKYHRDSTYDFETFLSTDSSINADLVDMWRKWRENGVTPENVKRVAEEAFSELQYSGALQREMQRWPQYKDAEAALEEVETWIDARFKFLDERFGYKAQ